MVPFQPVSYLLSPYTNELHASFILCPESMLCLWAGGQTPMQANWNKIDEGEINGKWKRNKGFSTTGPQGKIGYKTFALVLCKIL